MFLNERLPLFSVALLLKLTRIWASFVTGDVNVIEGGGGGNQERGGPQRSNGARRQIFRPTAPNETGGRRDARRRRRVAPATGTRWDAPTPPPSLPRTPSKPFTCALFLAILDTFFFFLELDERQRSSRLKLIHPGVEGRRYREIDFKSCPR